MIDKIAAELTKGKVIAWFQGKPESGPRALGNRSILADPRVSNIKDYLNKEIKKRERFRPYAPSVLYEYMDEWFENSTYSPYMLKIFKFKKDKGELVPGVCHVDNTARAQTIKRNFNPKFYDLIHTFYILTGVPMLLNTSFNIQEPIINTKKEALSAFHNSKIDILVVNDEVFRK
ncbi:MAG: hypothetical protein K9M01_04745 [Candidatus Omnitrophica bacterium]|nr:hypothetical protein [Candidatus Omnitrophota bacterium]